MKDIDYYLAEEPEIEQQSECNDKTCYFNTDQGCMTEECIYEVE